MPALQPPETRPEDNHCKLHSQLSEGLLRDAAQLAYKLGDIPKPELVDLMNLYIGWGLSIQKKKWLDRVGYR